MDQITYKCPGNVELHFIYELLTDNPDVVPAKNQWTAFLSGTPVQSITNDIFDTIFNELGNYEITVEMFDVSDTSLGSVILNHLVLTELKALFQLDNLNGNQFTFGSISGGYPDTFQWFIDGIPSGTTSSEVVTIGPDVIEVGLEITRIVDGESDFVEIQYTGQNALCDDKYEIMFYKKDCHKFIVINPLLNETEVILTDFKGNIISTVTVDPSFSYVPIETPQDGVYQVELKNITIPLEDSIFIPIYDTCDTEQCYYNLVTQVQCSEECIDCNENDKNRVEKTREALNRMTGLMFFLEKYIKIETDKYLGLTTIDASRRSDIAKVDLVLKRLEITMNLCSDCYSDIGIEDSCQNC